MKKIRSYGSMDVDVAELEDKIAGLIKRHLFADKADFERRFGRTATHTMEIIIRAKRVLPEGRPQREQGESK